MTKTTWTVSTGESTAKYKGKYFAIKAKLLIVMEKETKRILFLKSYNHRRPIKSMLKYCLNCDIERPILIEVDTPVNYNKISGIKVIYKGEGNARSCPEEEFWEFLHIWEIHQFPDDIISKTEDYKVFVNNIFNLWNEEQKKEKQTNEKHKQR